MSSIGHAQQRASTPFATALDARRFLVRTLGRPLGLLPAEQLSAIDEVLSTTLDKSRIVDALKALLERRSAWARSKRRCAAWAFWPGRDSLNFWEEPMTTDAQKELAIRVASAAQNATRGRGFATPIDVLLGLGWLTQAQIEQWRQGRIPYLERVTTANLSRLSRAMSEFRWWARETGKRPSRTEYKHRSHTLRFSKSGDPKIEETYRTHFLCPRKFPPAASAPRADASASSRRNATHESQETRP